MAKRNKEPADEIQQELTKKQERLRQRERQQHRTLYLGLSIAIGAAIFFVILGLVSQLYLRPNRAVATVGTQSVVAKNYWKRMRLEKSNLQNLLVLYQQREQQFGNQGIFTQQINQLQATLASPFSLGQQTLNQMVEEIMIQEEATKRGISVSDEEVAQGLREEVANSQGLVTEAQATSTVEAWANATATAVLWTPTPEPTASAALTGTAGLTGTAALTTTAAVTPTATPEPLPTPAVITDTSFTKGLATLEERVKTISGMSVEEYSQVIRLRLLRAKLQKVIGEEKVAATDEEVKARHILISEIKPTPTPTVVPEGQPTPEPTPTSPPLAAGAPTPTPTPAPRTREEALALATDLRQQLADGGDFATLAAQYSNDPSNKDSGGELGWFAKGAMVAPFDEAAFSLPIGEISQPISTTFGVHLIEVEEKDPQHVKEPSALEQERANAFTTWLQEQITAANVQRNDVTANLPRDLQ